MECRSEHHTYTGMFWAMLLRCDFYSDAVFSPGVVGGGGGGGGGWQALGQGGGRNVRDY